MVQITCDYCHKPVTDSDKLVRIEATTFGPSKSGTPPVTTPFAVSEAVDRIDLHERCWPAVRAKALG